MDEREKIERKKESIACAQQQQIKGMLSLPHSINVTISREGREASIDLTTVHVLIVRLFRIIYSFNVAVVVVIVLEDLSVERDSDAARTS